MSLNDPRVNEVLLLLCQRREAPLHEKAALSRQIEAKLREILKGHATISVREAEEVLVHDYLPSVWSTYVKTRQTNVKK